MYLLPLMLILLLSFLTFIMAYKLDVLDYYAYILAVVLFTIGMPFLLFGRPLIALVLFIFGALFSGILFFYQSVKQH